MEHVDFASKKAAERFHKVARKDGWDVQQSGNSVKHLGNNPGFTQYAKRWLAQRRTHATVAAG